MLVLLKTWSPLKFNYGILILDQVILGVLVVGNVIAIYLSQSEFYLFERNIFYCLNVIDNMLFIFDRFWCYFIILSRGKRGETISHVTFLINRFRRIFFYLRDVVTVLILIFTRLAIFFDPFKRDFIDLGEVTGVLLPIFIIIDRLLRVFIDLG